MNKFELFKAIAKAYGQKGISEANRRTDLDDDQITELSRHAERALVWAEKTFSALSEQDKKAWAVWHIANAD